MTTHRQRGVSLIEATIVMIVIAVLSVMIVQSIKGLATTQTYTRGQARVLEVADRVAQDIARDVRFAVRAYSEAATNRQFLSFLALKPGTLSASNRFPIASRVGMFDVDPPTKPYTGNALFIVKSLPSQIVDLSQLVGIKKLYRIDAFQFLIYYVTQRADGRQDIGRWSSHPVASYTELSAIEDENERAKAVAQLADQGVCCAWDPTEVASLAFYNLDARTGAMTLATAADKPVRQAVDLSIEEMLVARHLEIAENGSVRMAVPKFATEGPNFPHGFEVRIDGPGTGRLVLIRLVVAKRAGDRIANAADVVRIVPLRDI